MRYRSPNKSEQNYISSKISITNESDYYRVIAKENIKKDERLIIENSEINLFGLNVESRELETLKLYLENMDLKAIQELYPRTNVFNKTKLVKNIHLIIKSSKSKYFNKYDKNIIEWYYAKYIFNAFEGHDYGPLTLPTIAKINHSCNPNVKFTFNKDTGSMHLYAIKDIKKGQEIYDSYLENKRIKSHKDYLKEHYGFDCRCSYFY
jgi:hypothetical protein